MACGHGSLQRNVSGGLYQMPVVCISHRNQAQ